MIRASTVNLLCFKCHVDKRGPFMWEHDPVEENCTTCHAVHGSQHRSLLIQRMPNLCQDCHTVGSHPTTAYQGNTFPNNIQAPAAQAFARGCVNCHARIHGSNAPHNPGKGAGYNSGKYFLK